MLRLGDTGIGDAGLARLRDRKALRELRLARRSAAAEILAPLTQEQREVLGGLLDTLVDGVPEVGRRC